MFNTPTSNETPPPPVQTQRLPNFLLSSSTTPPTPLPQSTPTHSQSQNPYPPLPTPPSQITFNSRLRTSPPPNPFPSSTLHNFPSTFDPNPSLSTTPQSSKPRSRIPPNKSLLDSGTPSILSLRSPAAPTSSPRHSHVLSPGSTLAQVQTPVSAHSPGVLSPGAERWVTVFGFGTAQESQALREMRRHGEIIRTVPGRGNWVHVMYRTTLQAQVALYKSWRVLEGTQIMVGVVGCTDIAVAKEAENGVERGVLVASPAGKVGNSGGIVGGGGRTPRGMIRREANLGGSGGGGIVRTPQRQRGVLDYISGFYK